MVGEDNQLGSSQSSHSGRVEQVGCMRSCLCRASAHMWRRCTARSMGRVAVRESAAVAAVAQGTPAPGVAGQCSSRCNHSRNVAASSHMCSRPPTGTVRTFGRCMGCRMDGEVPLAVVGLTVVVVAAVAVRELQGRSSRCSRTQTRYGAVCTKRARPLRGAHHTWFQHIATCTDPAAGTATRETHTSGHQRRPTEATATAATHPACSTRRSRTRRWSASASSGARGCLPASSHKCGPRSFSCMGRGVAAATSCLQVQRGKVAVAAAASASRAGSNQRNHTRRVSGADRTCMAPACAAERSTSLIRSSVCRMGRAAAAAAQGERRHTPGVVEVVAKAEATARPAHSSRCSGIQRV